MLHKYKLLIFSNKKTKQKQRKNNLNNKKAKITPPKTKHLTGVTAKYVKQP